MRTTLDLDDDILAAARQLASQRRSSIGQTVSDLARRGLQPTAVPKMRNGVPLLRPKKGATPPTVELINRLRDEE